VTAALVAAVAVWGVSLPPRRTALTSTWTDGTVRGILHVHSRVSDGRGTLDDIAGAAARAGLQFVVVTDHGDGTRRPEPASYRSGILVIDAVPWANITEIQGEKGQKIALPNPAATPLSLTLPVGKYHVVLAGPASESKPYDITVEAGKSAATPVPRFATLTPEMYFEPYLAQAPQAPSSTDPAAGEQTPGGGAPSTGAAPAVPVGTKP